MTDERILDVPTFTMDIPAASGNGKVNYRDPPTGSSADENYLCDVHGTYSEDSCTISAIYVWNSETRSNKTGQALSEEIQTNGKLCQSDRVANSAWYFDQTSSPKIDGFFGPNFADRVNYISAVAIYQSSSGCSVPDWGIPVGPISWTAQKCLTCPVTVHVDEDDSKMRKASLTGLQAIAPTIDGDWLHYAINLQQRVNNYRLLDSDGNGFLSADEIAVAAQVQWRPSPTRELVIRDPQGISDCRIRDYVDGRRPLMRFQGLPKFSLVLWQPNVARTTVVSSQSRENPLEMSLDPDREIVVELNDNNQSLTDNEGTIDLWVKLPGLNG